MELNVQHRALIEAAVENYRKFFEKGLNDGMFAERCQQTISICDDVLKLINE